MSEDLSRQLLESEVERLQKQNEEYQRLLERPVTVTTQSADTMTLRQIEQYLPQLTHMATNLSYVSSAIQQQTIVLERIAKVLEDRSKGIGSPL